MRVWHNEKEKWIHGGAAWTYTISQNGGWDAHHKKIVREAINEFVENVFIPKLNKEIGKPPLKRVR